MTEYAPILLGDDAPIGDAVQGIIVGTDPLEIKDGDTAYVETYQEGAGSSMVSFRLPPGVTTTPGARVWIEAEAKNDHPGGGLVIFARPASEGFSASITSGSVYFTSSFTTILHEIDFASMPAEYGPDRVMRPDTVFHIANSRTVPNSATVRTTWLRFIVEGAVYLRNFPRDDGLGNSAPRNYPRSSRQRSLRSDGYE